MQGLESVLYFIIDFQLTSGRCIFCNQKKKNTCKNATCDTTLSVQKWFLRTLHKHLLRQEPVTNTAHCTPVLPLRLYHQPHRLPGSGCPRLVITCSNASHIPPSGRMRTYTHSCSLLRAISPHGVTYLYPLFSRWRSVSIVGLWC